jgi:hypothetical protein
MPMKGMFVRRLMAGLLTAALMVLWTALIVRFNPHALAFYTATPQLAVTLGLAFAGAGFLIGAAPGRSDP